MLQLALKTGWTLEYIESLPYEIISEYMALNRWVPFTDDRQAQQLGDIYHLLSAQVYKTPVKPEERYPYLKSGVPDEFLDSRIRIANQEIKGLAGLPEEIVDQRTKVLVQAIDEDIADERSKHVPDRYVIRELNQIKQRLKHGSTAIER